MAHVGIIKVGGAGRDRTDYLLNANQALSQLSYSPLLVHYRLTHVVVAFTPVIAKAIQGYGGPGWT